MLALWSRAVWGGSQSVLTLAWAPAIGDPTILGWTITLAYAAGTWLALRAAAIHLHAREVRAWRGTAGETTALGEKRALAARTTDARQRAYLVRFWCFAAFVLALLCINKQLDVQTLFTESAREIAQFGGWYRERKSLQFALLGVAFAAAVVCALWMLWMFRFSLRRVWVAVCGLVVLAAYIAMRGTSHHAVNAFMRLGPFPLRDSMELVGIAMIAWPAWRTINRVEARRSDLSDWR